jgi:hypothetical protein
MDKLVADPGKSFDQNLQDFYNQLDAFINLEEKDKSGKDFSAWAAEVNTNYLQPIEALFKAKFANELPLKFQALDVNPKTKKDDHLKRLKAARYSIFTYQRKVYLDSVGDLS